MKSFSRSIPTDPILYEKVVAEAKQRFHVWPSAYASGWVVHTYKDRGGKYSLSSKKQQNDKRPLARWYREEWIDVCRYLEEKAYKPCGRQDMSTNSKIQKKTYPYCRPRYRVTEHTPETLEEIIKTEGRQELVKRCRKKKKHPEQRIL